MEVCISDTPKCVPYALIKCVSLMHLSVCLMHPSVLPVNSTVGESRLCFVILSGIFLLETEEPEQTMQYISWV
jgi:hypothetical protein